MTSGATVLERVELWRIDTKRVTDMPPTDDHKHFIVKHGLDAFDALPNFIWRVGKGPDEAPHRFKQVKFGDRWIGYAYTTGDERERPLSLVTGFYECTEEASYRPVPPEGLPLADGEVMAWMIEGKPYGDQPLQPVDVPPIADLLGKPLFNQQAIIPITIEDFERIRGFTFAQPESAT